MTTKIKYGVPQGSVLGPITPPLYILALSTIIRIHWYTQRLFTDCPHTFGHTVYLALVHSWLCVFSEHADINVDMIFPHHLLPVPLPLLWFLGNIGSRPASEEPLAYSHSPESQNIG